MLKHTHLGYASSVRTSRSSSITHAHTSSCLMEIWFMMTHTSHIHTPIPMPTLDCLHRRIFLFHAYRSGFFARIRRYTQLTYVFQQYATSFLSRDGRIDDCTVRHPDVERPFSSSLFVSYAYCFCFVFNNLSVTLIFLFFLVAEKNEL